MWKDELWSQADSIFVYLLILIFNIHTPHILGTSQANDGAQLIVYSQ